MPRQVGIIGPDGKVISVTTDGTKERLDVSATVVQNVENRFRPGEFVSRHLELSGSKEMNVDGSTTSKDFIVEPGTGKIYYVSRLILIIRDENINHLKFGGLAALTNGIQFKVTESGTERNLHQEMVKTNAEFHHICYDVRIVAAASDMLTMRWSFFKSGTYLQLKKSTSDRIKVTIQDDLTNLLRFQVLTQGFEVTE